MKRKDLDSLKAQIREKADKATDMDILITAMLALPKGQLKKLLSADVLAVLAKYGYTE